MQQKSRLSSFNSTRQSVSITIIVTKCVRALHSCTLLLLLLALHVLFDFVCTISRLMIVQLFQSVIQMSKNDKGRNLMCEHKPIQIFNLLYYYQFAFEIQWNSITVWLILWYHLVQFHSIQFNSQLICLPIIMAFFGYYWNGFFHVLFAFSILNNFKFNCSKTVMRRPSDLMFATDCPR